MLQAQDRIAITSNANDHLQYSLTLLQSLHEPKVEAPKVVTPPIVQAPKDSDGDGIPDDKDECPTQAGPPALNGCPDKDGDGIADKNDKCPDVAGLVKYQGCPVPDTDKDGINDENDKCPTVPGLERYQGCPIPDTDGDGLNDEEDKCPQVAGRAADYGCPAVLFEAKKIQFATGKATLLPVSFTPLNKVVAFMKENPEVKIDVLGHTDNTGTDAVNEKLSQKRAEAVAQYFTKKGISADRISSKGFGSTEPIADNKTAAGRAQNRRTEFLFHR
jgi:outer membrane protein OmpA-like peptidoglycan-associated protein